MEAAMIRVALFVFMFLAACNPTTHVFFFAPHEAMIQATDFLSDAAWVATADSALIQYETEVPQLLPETEYFPCIFLDGQPIEEFPQLFFGEEDAVQVGGKNGCFEVRTNSGLTIARREVIHLAFPFEGSESDTLYLEWEADQIPCEIHNGRGTCNFGIIEAGSSIYFRLMRRGAEGHEYLVGVNPLVVRSPLPNTQQTYEACELAPGEYGFSFLQSGSVTC